MQCQAGCWLILYTASNDFEVLILRNNLSCVGQADCVKSSLVCALVVGLRLSFHQQLVIFNFISSDYIKTKQNSYLMTVILINYAHFIIYSTWILI